MIPSPASFSLLSLSASSKSNRPAWRTKGPVIFWIGGDFWLGLTLLIPAREVARCKMFPAREAVRDGGRVSSGGEFGFE
jgi:hypothetical protein